MRNLFILFVLLLWPITAYCDKVTINLETEGTLEEVITNQDVLKITELVITGRITAEDIIYLRNNIGTGRIANLETLDLKDVTLVASETPYFEDSKIGEFYLSDEEKIEDENRNSSVSGGGFWMEGRNYTYTYYYGKSLPYVFKDMPLKKVVLPSSVHKIGTSCFYSSSIETVEVPGGITEIEENAFCNCSSLVSILSTSSVTKIGYRAFYYCSSLPGVDLSSVEMIGMEAFSECTSLATVGSLAKVSQMGEKAFYDCNSLEGMIDLSGMTVVPISAFENCKKIEGLTFSNKLSEISSKAFTACIALTAVELPEGLETIEGEAFEGCKSLESVTIPSTLSVMDYSCFAGTPWLENYAIDDDGMMCINNVALRYYIDTDLEPNYVLTFREGIVGIADGFQIQWRNPKAHNAGIATENITGLEFPSTLQFIGDGAFLSNWCETSGSSVTSEYTGLTKLVFPASLKRIGGYAFPNTIESITFSEGLEEIGKNAFYNCSKLEELNLPSSLKRIGENAFGNCTGLSELTIPENVENINFGCESRYTDGDGAFAGCTGIIIVRVYAKNLLKEVHYKDYYNANLLGKLGGLEKVIIGSKVEVLPAGLFYNGNPKTVEFEERSKDSKLFIGGSWIDFDNISSLVYPDCKLSFGDMLLDASRYNNVEEIKILGEIEEIGDGAFTGSPIVGSVRLSDDMKVIPDEAFDGCTKLTSFNMPKSLVSIGAYAFDECTSLAMDVVIPDGVTTIGNKAFSGSGITSVTIGNGLVEAGSEVFRGCSCLTSITFDKNIPSFGSYTFDGTNISEVHISDLSVWCSSDNNYLTGKSKHLFLNDEEIINLVIPDGVTTIGKNAFHFCEFITSVTIPNSVTTIGSSAFYDCFEIKEITIPNSVTSIGYSAFANCYNMKKLTVPSSVTSLGKNAFYECRVDTVYFFIKEPPTEIPFSSYGSITLYVPVGSRDLYMATEWKNFKVIYESNGTVPEDAIVFEDSKLGEVCVSPNSNMDTNHDGYLSTEEAAAVTNWDGFLSVTQYIKTFTKFDEFKYFTGLKEIPEYAFNGWEKLTSITLPNNIKKIGNQAFNGCEALTSIDLPNSLEEIGDYAFGYCLSLTKIAVPSNVTTMGESVFACCKGIETAIFESEVVTFGDLTSSIEMGLTSVTFGDKVKVIDENAFYGCKKLTEVVIPENVTTIGKGAFWECSGMKTLTIGKNVTSIGHSAFRECESLTSVYSYIEEPFEIVMEVFLSVYNATLYVPAGTADKYKAKKYWNKFTNIVEMDGTEGTGKTEETESEPITISGALQVPYYSEYNLDFTDKPELKAYVATGYDKSTGVIWLTRVKQVPAETGFLLMGDPGDYDIPTIEGVSDVYYKNMFKGTLEGTTLYTTDGDYTNYYLSKGDAGVGFYKVTKEDGVKVGANRCYLPILTEIPANGSTGDTEMIKVSAAKQVPYYTSKNLDFSSLDAQGVKAYTATGYNYGTGVIWLTRVKKVPAQTGILVMADVEGDYNVPTTSVQSVYENMFVGSETAQTIYTNEEIGGVDYVNYYLSKGDAGVGFYKVTNPDGVKMGANRCYLPIPKRDAASGARGKNGESAFCKMVLSDESNDDVIAIPLFTDGTTGIDIQSSIFNLQSNEVYYNLQGQRVENPRKGLYIHNGRRVVIRSTTK